MVDLHQEVLDAEGFQDLLHDSQNFCIWNHCIVLPCNVEIALVELSKPTFGDGGLISTIDLPDVESFDLLDVRIVSHEAGEGDSEVVSESALLPPLVFQVVD